MIQPVVCNRLVLWGTEFIDRNNDNFTFAELEFVFLFPNLDRVVESHPWDSSEI
jgi:hypothetical protein